MQMSDLLDGSIVVVTGGTGSFGSTMVSDLLSKRVAEVRVFSRDENKQDNMRRKFNDSRLKFFLGDVRDKESVQTVIKGSDYVFHAAALKQVPSCEFFPMQANATNVIGSSNVIEAAYANDVKTLVCLSSDKAVYPINSMGMTKALMERVAQSVARNYSSSRTRVAITRYGNVMMSRGSVIPLFVEQIRQKSPITVTNPNMTRFMMSLAESVSLVQYAFTHAESGDIFVRKAPACTVDTLVRSLIRLLGFEGRAEIRIIGTRHGEKLYETLMSSEERARSIDEGDYFRVPLDTRSLDYEPYFESGNNYPSGLEPYTSHNSHQLTIDEVCELIANLPEYAVMLGN